jgi:hypothetical protein
MQLASEWGHRDRSLGKCSLLGSKRAGGLDGGAWGARIHHRSDKQCRRRHDPRPNTGCPRRSSLAGWARLPVCVGGTLISVGKRGSLGGGNHPPRSPAPIATVTRDAAGTIALPD